MPTHSEFSRFEDRVDDTIDKQIARLETRLEPLAHVVRDLAVLGDRQAHAASNLKEVRQEAASAAERFEGRAKATAERFDDRVSDLVKGHSMLEAKVEKYVQRYVGGSACIAVAWAVANHFLK